jgi:hypothetical protein
MWAQPVKAGLASASATTPKRNELLMTERLGQIGKHARPARAALKSMATPTI